MVTATCMSLEGLSWNNSLIPCHATHKAAAMVHFSDSFGISMELSRSILSTRVKLLHNHNINSNYKYKLS